MPDVLPIVDTVGDAFGRNVEKIRSLLMDDDQVLRVGICGMGGVGKTTLMRRIQTLLERQSSFDVYWITVSQDFSICKLQNLIAKQVGLNFSDEQDEVKRAKSLAQAMLSKRKCVLILDDLWNYFDVNEVGIPVGENLCKLVLTTRLLQVCRQMDCKKNTIQMQRLSDEEAWILFTQELGNYNTEVEELVKDVCRQCAGLPLGIKVLARSMKGICSVHTWRNTLEELKESKVSKGHEMRDEVFSVLKSSYLRLNDPALQECLSYCALVPEDYEIERNELIEYMIFEGIIDEKKIRQAELDRGHTMLDTLENACLLEGDTYYVWMHDLIRDMLILGLREGSKTLVEAGAQLKELPDVEKWTENLVRVSLIFDEIPYCHTPRCPNLSTLLLRDNHGLRMISDSFFEQFQRLKVLDLSGCSIKELPRKCVSVSGGDNFIDPLALPTDIEALQIVNCSSTLYKGLFPPSLLASLLNLQEIIVCYWGAIEEIFAINEGENGEWVFPFSNYSTPSLSDHSLLNLKIIDIRWCYKLKKLFPPSLLPNLHNLQEISVQFCFDMEEIFSTGREEEDGQELLFDPPNLTGLHLSRLTTLELLDLPKLRSIYNGAIICPSLQEITLVDCRKLKRITLPLPQPSLQSIQVYPKELWESLHWGEANDKSHLESLCVFEDHWRMEGFREEWCSTEEEEEEEEVELLLGLSK